MFDKGIDIPKKLKQSPLTDVILEIRFDTKLSGESLYGRLYDTVFKDFSEKVESTPLLQLPAYIRDNDKNLKYKPLYRSLDKKDHVISLGTHSLIFEHLAPYTNWAEWNKLFYTILAKLNDTEIITKVTSCRFCSINCFKKDITKLLNIDINIDNELLKSKPFSLYTQFDLDLINIDLNVKNSANLPIGLETEVKSLISIDCHKEYKNKESFWESYKEDIENAHKVNKKVFFGIIKKELLDLLEPVNE